MTGKKYKFNVINDNGYEEPYIGIFHDDDLDKICPKDSYTKALEWFKTHGRFFIKQGRQLVFRECKADGHSEEEELPEES